MKNYYRLLGIDIDASWEQIRTAYRRYAKELHPDYYGDDSGPFRDLQEAYAVLSDPARRLAYDKLLRQSLAEHGRMPHIRAEPLSTTPSGRLKPEPLIPPDKPEDLGDLSLSNSFDTFLPSFEELFDRLWRNFDLAQPEFEPLKSLNIEIRISPEEARRGGRVRLHLPARLSCPVCHGRGGVGFYRCWQCDGDGLVEGEFPVLLSFPPGIVESYVTEIPLDQLGIHNFYLRVFFRVGTD